MRGESRLIKKFYRLLLAFYPAEFRAEFGAEMEDVFTIALTHVQQSDGERSWRLIWREIRDWPGTVLQAHLRVRKRKMASDGFVEEKPLPRRELLAALLIFLLPFAGPLGSVGDWPEWLKILLGILYGGALLFGLGLAVMKRLPRWSLPYLGIVLMPAVLYTAEPKLWGWLYPRFLLTFGPRAGWSLSTRILYSGVNAYIALFLILFCALLLANVLRLLPYTRGVWQGIRVDWTALSFLLYGGLVIGVDMLFEEYRYDNIWRFFAWISLALGAWLYLRAKGQKQRILALLGGATGALWIVALAKWVLIPLQKWPMGYPVSPSEATRWVETSMALVSWVGIIILLLAPAVLSLLPPASGLTVSESKEPVTA
jgi:hypothetical protein